MPQNALAPGGELASLRPWQSLSQADFVRAIPFARAAVSDIVGTKRPFTVDQMQVVAKAFGLRGILFMPKTVKESRC
jgi:hypothetical protein